MKKIIISILLAAVLTLSLVPAMVFAGTETTYPVWVEGIQVTKSNMTDVLGAADGNKKSVAFDPKTNTLTLSDATLALSGDPSGFIDKDCVCGVRCELDKLTVVFAGKNQIGKEASGFENMSDYSIDVGFKSTGDIVFTGDKNSSTVIYDFKTGIMAKNVTFDKNFKGKLTVRDAGGPEPMPPCCAIATFGTHNEDTYEYLSDGNVSILGGTFDFISYGSCGIEATGNVMIKNADVTVAAQYVAIESRYGDITAANAKLSLKGDGAIYCNEDILFDTVELKASADGMEAINGRKKVTFTGCPVIDIYGADEAIMVSGKVSFINCTNVKLESNELNTVSAGDILADNSTMELTANNGYSGFVARADEDGNGTVTINDSKITVNAEGSGIKCNALTVSGGKTELYSKGDTDSDGKGCGAIIEGDESAISITGCTVKLTGGEAALRLQKGSEADPFTHSLSGVTFFGNTAFDTFTSMQTVNYKSAKDAGLGMYCEYAYVGDVIAKSVSVTHVHKSEKVDGVAPTTKKAGYKSYYKCDCGKFFEDADCKTEITDLKVWKAKGGNGYLKKLDNPDTGDGIGLVLWTVMMTVSAAGVAFSRSRAKRKN